MAGIYFLRGHPITLKDKYWIYRDTETPTEGNTRNCGHCGKENTEEGHDGCLGTLQNLMNACCGHGIESEAYIQFLDGKCIRGKEALAKIKDLIENTNSIAATGV